MSGFRTSIRCLEYFSTLCSSKEYTYQNYMVVHLLKMLNVSDLFTHYLPLRYPNLLGRFILNVLMLGQYPRNGMFYYPNFSCHHIRGWPDYFERASSWGLVPKRSVFSFFKNDETNVFIIALFVRYQSDVSLMNPQQLNFFEFFVFEIIEILPFK